MSDTKALPDGVYLGFNIPGVNGKSIPHPWIEVVKDGRGETYEYGPAGDKVFGAGSQMINMNRAYGDNDKNAAALFVLKPSPGTTNEQLISRASAAGKALDTYLSGAYVPYVPVMGADCDTAALSIVHSLGASALQFEEMTASAKAGNVPSRGFADVGGLSVALTAGAVADSYMLTYKVWEKVGAAPGIPFPGLGSLRYTQLERDSHGRWVEAKQQSDRQAQAEPSARGGAEPTIHVERDGIKSTMAPGSSQRGRIVALEDDRIVQDVGRGRQASYSRKELEAHFSDKTAFDAMMQPGHYVNISTSRRGVVDVQQDIPGHGWHSLANVPLASSQLQSVGRDIGP